jgi:hypothetical protein
MKAFFISILIDTRTSAKRQTKRSSDKEAWLGIRVVTWQGIEGVDSLNSKSVILTKDLA